MLVTPKAAQKYLQKRKQREIKDIPLDSNFPLQNAFILDNSRFIAAQCSRRAGKSNGIAYRFFRTMETHPGALCIYLSLTRESAMSIMWPVLQEINDKFKLGCRFVDSKLTMYHPNGSKLRLIGADAKNFIKRLRGIKTPGVAIDEAQDFGPHLASLVDDVITPAMSDYTDSWLAITGTPGPVPMGYFFEVTQEGRYGYSLHKWTLLQNPHMPNPAGFLDDLIKRREWRNDNPTLRREWRNEWVLDLESLWIKYEEKVNHYDQLPDIKPSQWNYILGIDLGFKDADALAIIAWHESLPTTYLVEEIITRKQTITDLVNQIQEVEKRYNISKMVIDEGGLGKKIAEELRRQKSIPVHQADKALKQQNVEFLNDALRTGRFKARGNSTFAQDSYRVQVDWEKSRPDKIVIKKSFHSDIIDAVLYAFKESHSFAYLPSKAKPKWGTKEWAEAQPIEMFQAELEGLQKEEAKLRYDNSLGWAEDYDF